MAAIRPSGINVPISCSSAMSARGMPIVLPVRVSNSSIDLSLPFACILAAASVVCCDLPGDVLGLYLSAGPKERLSDLLQPSASCRPRLGRTDRAAMAADAVARQAGELTDRNTSRPAMCVAVASGRGQHIGDDRCIFGRSVLMRRSIAGLPRRRRGPRDAPHLRSILAMHSSDSGAGIAVHQRAFRLRIRCAPQATTLGQGPSYGAEGPAAR